MLKLRRIFVFPIAVTFSVLFILYIISWFSPIAGDSFIHDRTGYLGQFHIRHVWKACVDSYLYWNPRLGEMAAFFITSAPRLVWTVLNPVFVLALVLGLYVLALGRMPNLRRECGAWTWLFALSMFVSAGVTVYYVCLTRAGSMNYVWTGCLIVWFMNIYRTRWGKRITSSRLGLSSGCLIYGIFCGACNEGATIGMAAAFCIMAAVGMFRDRRVGAYVWCGFAGVALGGLFLFAAPGLYSRLGHDLGASEVLRKGGFCAYAESFGVLLYYHARMLCKIYAVSAVLTGFLLSSGTERCREVIRKEKESFFYILFLLLLGFIMSVCYFPVCIPAHHVQFVSSLPVLAASTVLFSVLYRNEIMVRGLRAVTVCLAGATLFFGVVFTLEYYHVGSQAFQREELIHKAFQEGNLEPEVPSISPLFFEGKVSGTDGNWGGPDTNRRFGIRKLVVKKP